MRIQKNCTHRLEELLEPLVASVLAAGDDDIGDVGGPSDEELVVLGLTAVLPHWHEQHVVEDVHDELVDALLRAHPADRIYEGGNMIPVIRAS